MHPEFKTEGQEKELSRFKMQMTHKITPLSRLQFKNLTVGSASQEIPHLLQKPKAHYCFHNSLPPLPVLSHKNPIHTPKSFFPGSISILPSCLGLLHGPLLSGFPCNSNLPMHVTCPAHHILLHLTSYKEYLVKGTDFAEAHFQSSPASCHFIPLRSK